MANPANILTVEDEEAIRELLSFSLQRQGHTVFCASSVPAAKAILTQNKIDIALVDWMLPGGSGIEFIRYLRADAGTQDMPIIMITAKTEEQDITDGLDAGADDYMCKPFSPKELNSRINALLRRSRSADSGNAIISVGALSLNTETQRAYSESSTTDEPMQFELGHTEYKLLRFFMENPERVLSREQLLDHVWGNGSNIEERTVDVHMLRLRKLLKPAGLDKMLETVRGAGYRLSAN